jgi:hypothetical protein
MKPVKDAANDSKSRVDEHLYSIAIAGQCTRARVWSRVRVVQAGFDTRFELPDGQSGEEAM